MAAASAELASGGCRADDGGPTESEAPARGHAAAPKPRRRRRRIFILRHGSRPDGPPDPDLDSQGRRQAQQVAAYLQQLKCPNGMEPITALFSSPFTRALQTAEPVARALGMRIRVEWGFCEVLTHNWQHYEDPLPALRRRHLDAGRKGLPPSSLMDGCYEGAAAPAYPDTNGRPRAGDTLQRERPTHRHREGVQAALSAAGGGSILVVGHGATHDFIAQALCPTQHRRDHHTPYCVAHCGITEIIEQNGQWRLRTFGGIPWKDFEIPAKENVVPLAVPFAVATIEKEQFEIFKDAAARRNAEAETARRLAEEQRRKLEKDAEAEAAELGDWIVVGGSTTGGIMVRKGASLKSPELDGRLHTGAILTEIEVVGGRLHYRKFRGDGPDFGWVSCTHKGVRLVESTRAPAGPPASGARCLSSR